MRSLEELTPFLPLLSAEIPLHKECSRPPSDYPRQGGLQRTTANNDRSATTPRLRSMYVCASRLRKLRLGLERIAVIPTVQHYSSLPLRS